MIRRLWQERLVHEHQLISQKQHLGVFFPIAQRFEMEAGCRADIFFGVSG